MAVRRGAAIVRRVIAKLRGPGLLVPLCTAGAAFLLYLATISPNIATVHGSTDSAELVTVAWVLGVAHPPGAAIWAPLGRIALAVLAFLPEPALRTNVLSAACMAGAVGLVVVIARRWIDGTPWWAAALAGALFATAPIPWSEAVITEVLALQMLLTARVLAVGVTASGPHGRGEPAPRSARRSLSPLTRAARRVGVGLLLGLLCWNHPTGLALAIPVGIVLLRAVRPGRGALAWGAAGFVLPGLWSIAYLVLRAHATVAWGDTGTLHGLWVELTGAEYRGLPDLSFAYARQALPPTERLALRQIPPPLWLAIPAGGLAAWRARPSLAAALAVAVVLLTGFVTIYRATGRDDYLATVALAGALTAAWGSVEAWRWLRSRLGARRDAGATTLAAYGLVAVLVATVAVWGAVNASQVSLRGDTATLDAARARLEAAPPGGTIESARDELTFPLWYLRVVRGERPDVTVVDVRGEAPVIRGAAPR
jgi:hypothetical protein